MTEQEWLDCIHVTPNVWTFIAGNTSERKLRLFAVACCRAVSQRFVDKRSQNAVDIAEKYADGNATEAELHAAYLEAAHAARAANKQNIYAAVWVCNKEAINAAKSTKQATQATFLHASYSDRPHLWVDIPGIRRTDQLAMLRDIVRNPFRPVSIDPDCFTWNDATISKVAQHIDDKRDYTSLPILADALEEGGCTNVDLLGHCRIPGQHVRGCWVVDLILGKK